MANKLTLRLILPILITDLSTIANSVIIPNTDADAPIILPSSLQYI